jgi:MFS family permease
VRAGRPQRGPGAPEHRSAQAPQPGRSRVTGAWVALAILFTARLAMAFQYQTIAALGPLYMSRYGVGLVDLGLLVAIYLSPGMFVALPGGGIARWIGDRRVVTLGLVLMLIGGGLMWRSDAWSLQIAGRLLAGTGGVLLNVLMTKMVTDWFSGGRLATAMGIFVNSWPVGIALALVVLPPLAAVGGLGLAVGVSVAFTFAGLILFLLAYRDPPVSTVAAKPGAGGWPSGRKLAGILAAGSIWGLYNGALVMVFAFGPTLLVARGARLAEASATTSLVLWLAALSLPAGGVIADRIGRPDSVLLAGCIAFALALAIAVVAPGVATFTLLGLACGLSAGPIMALPGRALRAETRALGMGIFFTVYYVWMTLAPMLGGAVSDVAGTADAAFVLGVAMLIAAAVLLGLFRRMAR